MMNESELRAVRDRLDIAEVMTRYAIGIDTRNSELLRGCFADEVEVQASSSGSPERTVQAAWFFNRAEAWSHQWVKMLGGGMAALPVTQHLIGNHLIEIDRGRGAFDLLPARDAFQRHAISGQRAL